MIAAWMLHAVLVGFLLAIGALAIEHLLRTRRRSVRWIWAATMVLSAGWPIALWVGERPSPPPSGVSLEISQPVEAQAPSDSRASPEPAVLQIPTDSPLRSLDVPLLLAWASTSGLLALFLLALVLRTRILERGWRTARLRGREVLLSREWGPAVVGFLRPRVVLPAWCEGLGPDDLDLVLAHETEHLRAGDLRLLLTAGLLPVLLPWHLPLWWQLARLRAAVEADCDLRVIRRHPAATRSYIDLLLAIGARPSGTPRLAALLSEPYRTLKRRIRIMTSPRPKHPRLNAALLTAAAVLFGVLACSAPPPSDSASTGGVDEAARPVFTPYSVAPNLDNAPQVTAGLQSAHAALEGAPEGRVDVWYFIGEDGLVQDTRIDRSSGSRALDELALRIAVDMRFTPALNRDRATPVWVSLPVVFGDGDAAPARPSDDPPAPPPAVVSNPEPGAVEGEGTGIISGVVRDAASGRPLQFGQVYLPESRRGTLTDGEGRFRIEGVPTGYHELVVELIGYRLSEARVAVGSGETTEVDAPLQATALLLQPLVVTPGG